MDNCEERNLPSTSSTKQILVTTTNEDSKINCSNSDSLRSILNITITEASKIAEATNLGSEGSERMSQFTNFFKNALQENVLVNGLPWLPDKTTLTSTEKEDHQQMVDDVLLAKLAKAASEVAHRRKYYPSQCCRLLSAKLQADMQYLKKTQISKSDELSSVPISPSEDDKIAIKKFSEFTEDFSSIQKKVKKGIKEREEVKKKIKIATDIQVQHKKRLKSSNSKQ